MEAENKLLDSLSATADATKIDASTPARRKGLAGAQRDYKGLVSQVKSNPEGRSMMDDMMKKMKKVVIYADKLFGLPLRITINFYMMSYYQ
mgnify:CR=1 FL=1